MYSVVDIMEMVGIPPEEIAKDVRMDIEISNYMNENINRAVLYRIDVRRICMEPDRLGRLWFDKE